jgi:hypothetical protein
VVLPIVWQSRQQALRAYCSNIYCESRREQRDTFSDKLAVIGGTLGLFSGMSILSMVEIICLCLKVSRRSWNRIPKQNKYSDKP